MARISRRNLLKVAASAALATGAAPTLARADAAAKSPSRYAFFTAAEASFIEAAVARLIPDDAIGPGAIEAGVPAYIDEQLAGAWGAGERLYRSGPWQPGAPSQGYQLPFTPAELFRNALRALRDETRGSGDEFERASAETQDNFLRDLQESDRDLNGVPAKIFFDTLLSMTIEGYFSDPVYGGNKGMAAWRMIGFPGAYAQYYHLVDRHGLAFQREPLSLGENGRGLVQPDPNLPAAIHPGHS